MKLEDIGFYTLCDERAKVSDGTTRMYRCEMILTNKCNFKCPYCRGLRDDCIGDMPLDTAFFVLDRWIEDGLKNVRFSGGEPTIYEGLDKLIQHCKDNKVEKIAISTNGSATKEMYDTLLECGANDFSISLDACCASYADRMAGTESRFNTIVKNIKYLSSKTYVTVGVVLTEDNVGQLKEIVEFADSLGVADIRIISAAQFNKVLDGVIGISDEILNRHPILKYRVNNIKNGRNVRGMSKDDYNRCPLAMDDSVVAGNYHFPCVIYMREHGEPIGTVGFDMREQRIKWAKTHDTFNDEICHKNCLDVCLDYSNKYKEFHFTDLK
jgi:MoaA/NifB/PqqE/SkfB family radical SAM enzyme